ncbi:MAG: LysR family transcriptional regulator [Rubellimicrobium sp.]|nr:LysR family transcriptional regulator [Rubellimicrobium sp.]
MDIASQIAQRLTFRHLRLVVAVDRGHSLVRAAQALNMSQSAVTKALQEVESLVGAELFTRTNRGVVTAPMGAALAENARLLLAQLGRTAHDLADLRDGSGGRVAVGTLLAASADVLPRAIATLHRERPGVSFRVLEATDDVLLPALRSGELDLTIGRLPEFRERADLSQEYLIDDHACLLVRPGHPLLGTGAPTLADTTGYGWVLPHEQTLLRHQFQRAFSDAGLAPPRPVVESVSLLTVRALIEDTDLIGILPVQVARTEAAAGHVAILPVDLPATRRPIGITMRRGDRLSAAAALFVDCLRRTAATLAPAPEDAQRQ